MQNTETEKLKSNIFEDANFKGKLNFNYTRQDYLLQQSIFNLSYWKDNLQCSMFKKFLGPNNKKVWTGSLQILVFKFVSLLEGIICLLTTVPLQFRLLKIPILQVLYVKNKNKGQYHSKLIETVTFFQLAKSHASLLILCTQST